MPAIYRYCSINLTCTWFTCPNPYRIDAEYMLGIMKPARREARLLANYLLSPEGQSFLVNKGFASRF
nr:hypothetical protein PJ912_04440 [Pectobacterium colocasium]